MQTDSQTPNAGIHILTNAWRTFDPRFGRADDVCIEADLGCGKGALALELAQRFPDRLVLACDVMLGRLRKVAANARRRGLDNLEVVRANCRDLVAYQLPPSSLDRVHVICPDPWPKTRHASRRLLNTDFLHRAVRVIKPGGTLHLATDDPQYREFMLEAIAQIPEFEMDASGALIADVADIKTGFEARWNDRGIDVPHVAFRCRK